MTVTKFAASLNTYSRDLHGRPMHKALLHQLKAAHGNGAKQRRGRSLWEWNQWTVTTVTSQHFPAWWAFPSPQAITSQQSKYSAR
jgi:hypothetical protein